MRSVADFYQDCISAVGQQPPLDVQLPDAVGCVLAEDVQAPFNLPVADLAACDGYAVAAADLEGARPDAPVVLPVTEEIRAGDIHPAALIRGRAIRIASGAPMPQGADAVLALEFSDHGVAKVSARLSLRWAKISAAKLRTWKKEPLFSVREPAWELVRLLFWPVLAVHECWSTLGLE